MVEGKEEIYFVPRKVIIAYLLTLNEDDFWPIFWAFQYALVSSDKLFLYLYIYIVELLHFSHFHYVSLVQWTNRLRPSTGGSGSRLGGATCTLELRLPVSAVSLQWWPGRDPWSPATISPLNLATGCFIHPSYPSSILTVGHRLMRHTVRIP